MSYFYPLLNTLCLSIAAAACLVHLTLNVDRTTPFLHRWGFILVGAGSFGEAVYLWWPKIESFPFVLLTNLGIALLASSLMKGELRVFVARLPGMEFFDRRKHETET